MSIASLLKEHDVGQPLDDLTDLVAKAVISEEPDVAFTLIRPSLKDTLRQLRRRPVRAAEKEATRLVREDEKSGASPTYRRAGRGVDGAQAAGIPPSSFSRVWTEYDPLRRFRPLWEERVNIDGAEVAWADLTTFQMQRVKEVGQVQTRGIREREVLLDTAMAVCREFGCESLRQVEKKQRKAAKP